MSSPAGCRARRRRRVEVLVFALLFLMTYGVLGFYRHLRVTEALGAESLFGFQLFEFSPAFAICAVLAILAMVYAPIASMPRPKQVPLVLLIVAWFGLANHDAFKNRFENMGYGPEDVVPLRTRVDHTYNGQIGGKDSKLTPAALVNDRDAQIAWKALSAVGDPDVDAEGRPKLVLVAVSGGATRSAYWTAVVLDRLEQKLGKFGNRVRIISGASGGMLGAACYVTYRRDVAECNSCERQVKSPPDPSLDPSPSSRLPDWIHTDLPKRSMEPLAWCIAFSEIWKAAWPGMVLQDRGVVLEKNWKVLRYPFASLAPLEAQGQVPSMIFSPMMVEDGRRLLITNLDLSLSFDADGRIFASSPLVEAVSPQINGDEFEKGKGLDGAAWDRYSLSGLEYYRIFREPAHRGLNLSTAVRMSASFPFVSPGVNLPTNPPRRVVDAGYYDNYGIQVATSWIRRNREWLAQNTSGVLLVQVRDSSSVRDRRDVNDNEPGIQDSISQGFQFFTSPIDAMTKARYTTASFRNDADVAALKSYDWDFGRDEAGNPYKPDNAASFFTTAIFENSAQVSLDTDDFWTELTKLDETDKPTKRDYREVTMSWYLARAEMDATARAIPDDPPKDSPWLLPENRRRIIQKLNGQVTTSMPGDESLASITEADKAERRSKGYLCYPPGPDRDIRQKRLEQLRNYERLVNLERWWKKDTPPKK